MQEKKNSMTRLLLILLLLSTSNAFAQKRAVRQMLIYSDSNLLKTVKSYEEFTFTDTGGKVVDGKIYIKNDSQFYFLNYFNEPKSRMYNINEIKGIHAYVYNEGYVPAKSKGSESGQRYFLSTGAVIAILIFTSYIGAVYLIVREIVLVSRYGHGHSLLRPERASSGGSTKTLKYKTNLKIQIEKI